MPYEQSIDYEDRARQRIEGGRFLTPPADHKADQIALAAMRQSLAKLRDAANATRKSGDLSRAIQVDQVADSLGDLCTELRERIEAAEVW
jgi:hypothetical protein